jgi:hypothetical protein
MTAHVEQAKSSRDNGNDVSKLPEGRAIYFFLSFILSFFHSFSSLCYERSIASSHRVQSGASSFNFQHPVFSLRPSISCLRLLRRLPVIYILPFIFPSITCFRRHFLRKVLPIQLAFLLFMVRRIFLSTLTLCNTSFLTRSVQLIFSVLLQHHISKLSRYSEQYRRINPLKTKRICFT